MVKTTYKYITDDYEIFYRVTIEDHSYFEQDKWDRFSSYDNLFGTRDTEDYTVYDIRETKEIIGLEDALVGMIGVNCDLTCDVCNFQKTELFCVRLDDYTEHLNPRSIPFACVVPHDCLDYYESIDYEGFNRLCNLLCIITEDFLNDDEITPVTTCEISCPYISPPPTKATLFQLQKWFENTGGSYFDLKHVGHKKSYYDYYDDFRRFYKQPEFRLSTKVLYKIPDSRGVGIVNKGKLTVSYRYNLPTRAYNPS